MHSTTTDYPTTLTYKGETVPFDRPVGEYIRGMSADPRHIEVAIPSLDDFDHQFMTDPDLSRLLEILRNRHMGHMAHFQIGVLWKRKGGKSAKRLVLGKAQLTQSGLLGYFTGFDAVIWLAADNLLEINATPAKVEAALFHELCSLQVDPETGNIVVAKPDFAGYLAEIEHYGLWQDGLKAARASFEQARMFADE